ncbi:MAG: hypothetical protein AAF488_12375, partial [Planctomycetota bacterium]
LEQGRWRIAAETSGNDYDISGVWQITRRDGTSELHLEFQGLDDLETLPIERAYSCRVREASDVSLYFRRKGSAWQQELREFVERLGRCP